MGYDPAYQRAYYLAHREALCQQQRDLYDRARDTKRKRAWMRKNRTRARVYQRAYRARRRANAVQACGDSTA